MIKNPREKLVEVAKSFLGIQETSRNRFPGDKDVWAATNYPDGWEQREPYCAAFVCRVVQLADAASSELKFRSRPKDAAVVGWKAWVKIPSNGVKVFQAPGKGVKILPGDIVSFLPHFSHIGIVEWYDDRIGMVHTIEANTSDQGIDGSQRDGDGIYRRARRISLCGDFYRLPCVGEEV